MLKKLATLLAGAALMVGVAAGSAMALTYTSTLTDLLNYKVLQSSPIDYSAKPALLSLGEVKFNTLFTSSPQTDAFVAYGLTFSTPLDLTGYDTFQLIVTNRNENPWEFGLFAGNTIINSLPVSIAVGSSALLTLDLTALTADQKANIAALGLYITADLPIITPKDGAEDYTAEFSAAPVPEPGTMVLFGAGLLGLAIFGKRRMNQA